MKTTFKKISELIENKQDCPLPLEVIPNQMGINLCSVEAISWQKQEDGQLINLTIHFLPKNQQSILERLQEILGKSAKEITRRPKQIGSVGGDTEKSFAFDIKFVEYEKHKNENNKLLDNMDYWMPIIKEKLNVSESYFHNSCFATIWINK